MHVISKYPFNEAARKYPNQKRALADLYKVLRNSEFNSPDEMRLLFPSLDNFKHKDRWWVLNVGGNHLRVIVFIQFSCNRIYVKHILTHNEYDKLCKRYNQGEL
ncbi:MAG: cytoplasmic protein [Gammaproteobacteria bacterium]|nr:MAG: cytoplasmic protein [Gammaproteobacteria bacterium]